MRECDDDRHGAVPEGDLVDAVSDLLDDLVEAPPDGPEPDPDPEPP